MSCEIHKFSIFFLIVTFFYFSCQNIDEQKNKAEFKLPSYYGPPAEFDNQNNKGLEKLRARAQSGKEEGILTAFRGLPEMRGTRSQFSFWLMPGDDFIAKYLVGNYFNKNKNFKMICLLDYKQIKFSLDNNYSDIHNFEISACKERILNLNFKDIPKGRHDFNLLIFDYPGKQSPEKLDAFYDVIDCYGQRSNIYSGSKKAPDVDFTNLPSQKLTEKARTPIELEYSGTTNINIWKVYDHSKIDYTIICYNRTDSTQKILLSALLDYRQIPIDCSDPNKSVRYFELAPNSRSTINASFILPEGKKEYELFVFSYIDPYWELEPEPLKVSRKSKQPDFSNRILIKIKK